MAEMRSGGSEGKESASHTPRNHYANGAMHFANRHWPDYKWPEDD